MERTPKDQSNAAAQEEQRRLARERIMRVVVTSEARQRLANIRMVKPEIAQAVENQVVQLASSGKLRKQVDDEDLKKFLGMMQEPKKDFKIRWV